MKVYEFTGKNVEEAKANGLKELNKSIYDVDIKVIDLGGFFRKAKIQIIVEDEEEVEERQKELDKKVEKVFDELNPQEVQEEQEEVVEEAKEEVEKQQEPQVKVHISEYENGEDVHEQEEKKEKAEKVYEDNKGTKQFLNGLLEVLNITGETTIEETKEYSKARVSCDNAGLLIGHRGETLSAIQYIANNVEQKQNKNAKRVIVDIAEYRERKDDNLKDLADRMARKVLKMRKPLKLKPMNAYDRRIVHTYLQGFKGITTHSEGVEPHRCLIIDIKRD